MSQQWTEELYGIEDVGEGCEGHPPGPFDPMGVTFYCDGSCRNVSKDPWPDNWADTWAGPEYDLTEADLNPEEEVSDNDNE